MAEDKIIEIAERYGRLENIDHGLAWVLEDYPCALSVIKIEWEEKE